MSRRHNAPPPLEKLPSDLYEDMTELDPSPIAESPLEPFPILPPAGSSSSRPHSREKLSRSATFTSPAGSLSSWLTRSQRYSSYAFTSFLGLHFTTTSLVPLITKSLPSSDNALILARTAYQSSPLLETILIPGCLGVHILAGIGLRLSRHSLATKRYGKAPSIWDKREWSLTSVAGWLLLPPLLAHSLVLRVIPLYLDGGSADVGLQYISHGFDYHGRIGWWLNAVYYVGFVTVASTHVVNGFAKYFRIRNRRRVNIAVGTLTVTWLGGLFGVITRAGPAPGYLGRKYDEFYGYLFAGLALRPIGFETQQI